MHKREGAAAAAAAAALRWWRDEAGIGRGRGVAIEEQLRRTNERTSKTKHLVFIEAAIDPFDVHVGLLLILVISRPMDQ